MPDEVYSVFGATAQLAALSQQISRQSPIARWQLVTALFTAADTDVDLTHTLPAVSPEDVLYLPVQQSAAGVIYHDCSATRKPWPAKTVILRSSAANNRVTLLLFLPATTTPSLLV